MSGGPSTVTAHSNRLLHRAGASRQAGGGGRSWLRQTGSASAALAGTSKQAPRGRGHAHLSSTSPAEKPSTGFFVRSAVVKEGRGGDNQRVRGAAADGGTLGGERAHLLVKLRRA